MSEPKISVIVPVYKVEPYLRKCLDSIVGQTYQNLEIILVDDGSPDGCGAICDEYAAQDKRVRVIHKANGGVSSARNAGLTAATGEWIGWVDSDDWIEPDMYSYMLRKAREYGADIAVCSRTEIYPDRKVVRGWDEDLFMSREDALALLLNNDTLQNYCCDKLFRAGLWERIVFPGSGTFEDMAVMYRLFERAEKTVCLPESTYNYLQRPESIVHNISLENRLNHYKAAEKRYGEMRENWPELEDLLLAQCAASAVGLWCGYVRNPREARRAALPILREVSAFCAPHMKRAAEAAEVGLAGRLVLKLIPYPTWWSFAFAGLVSWLYERKHGSPL